LACRFWRQGGQPVGVVEMDETWVGGLQAGLKGSRQLKGRKAALVIVAVERRGTATGRARMDVIPDFTQKTMTDVAGATSSRERR
jgi:ISXO2-like transposase domain